MNFVGPYPIEDVIERVSAKVSLAEIVDGAAALQAVLDSPPDKSPALYITSSETGGPEKYSGSPVIQDASVQLFVMLLVRSAKRERLGQGAKEKATDVIKQLRETLIGWTPHEAFTPLTFNAKRDERYAAGWYAGQHIFVSGYRIQNQPTD